VDHGSVNSLGAFLKILVWTMDTKAYIPQPSELIPKNHHICVGNT
jgi:hypothetical protein